MQLHQAIQLPATYLSPSHIWFWSCRSHCTWVGALGHWLSDDDENHDDDDDDDDDGGQFLCENRESNQRASNHRCEKVNKWFKNVYITYENKMKNHTSHKKENSKT